MNRETDMLGTVNFLNVQTFKKFVVITVKFVVIILKFVVIILKFEHGGFSRVP